MVSLSLRRGERGRGEGRTSATEKLPREAMRLQLTIESVTDGATIPAVRYMRPLPAGSFAEAIK